MNSGKKLLRSLSFLSLLVILSSLFASAAFADGASVYNSNCAGCHRLTPYDTSGSPELYGKGSQVSSYYSPGVSGHKSRTLTATNITELAAFLNNPTTTATPLAISTSSLAGATVGTAYSQTLAASGGTTPYSWTRSAGTLPTGLSLSSSGVISGTPSAAGTFSFTVTVTDSATTRASLAKTLSITVAAAPATTPLAIITASLANGTVGSAYSQTLAASGGRTPYSWTRSAGTLPTGLTLSSSGVISGTPSATGTFSFTARVTDSASPTVSVTKTLSITIAAATTVSGATVYNNRCASCHRLGTYDTSGSAPNLLGDGSRVDSYYTAGRSGHQGITLTAAEISAVKSFINNPPSTSTTLAISTTALTRGMVSVAYSQTLTATGGTPPYTWSRYSGTLPTGLTLGSNGVISGTPTATGTFSFTARVRDSASTQASVTKTFTIAVDAYVPPLAITTSSLAHATVGTAYSQNLAVTGGLAPYAWSYSGTLPAGIVVTSSGLISGTPTTAGSYNFTVLVSDSRSTAITKDLAITVAAMPMTDADKALFINNCSNCHTPFGLEKRTASEIRTAISGNAGGMATSQLQALSGTNLDGIARALTPSTPPANDCASCHSATTPPPASSPGQALYDLQCAGCHSLGTYDTSGSPNLLGRGSAVAGKFGSAHYGISLTSSDITNVATFINSPSGTPSPSPTPPPTQSCTSCHGNPPSTGSHSDHRSRSCSSCHGSGYSSTTVNTATHNNGVKNVVSTIGWNATNRTCSNSCHGTESW